MYGMISPGQVSNRPIWRHRLNIGFTRAIGGNIAIRSAEAISSCFPPQSSRATA